MASLMIRQEHFVTMETLRVLGFTVYQPKMRDKWIILHGLGAEFGDRPLVCKCKRRSSVDDMWTIYSIVIYLLLNLNML